METLKFYTIMVGGAEPANVLFGTLNKTSMQPDEGTREGKIGLGLDVMPNYSRVWGKRGEEKGKPTGVIEFLTWGDPKGEAVEIRYLPNSRSLDLSYQTNVEKLKVQDKDAEISLNIGLNKFDYKDKAPLIEMLKHHTFNGDNKSRDPSNPNISFVEYNPTNRIKEKTSAIQMRRDAEEFVMDCEGDDNEESLAVLADIFEMSAQDTNEVLYENLLQKAIDNPKNFIFIIHHKRDQAKMNLQAAIENGFVDFTQPGLIQMRDGTKKKTLIDGLEELETAEDKINFLVKNLTVPKYYEVVQTITKTLKAFQQAQLQ